MTDRHGAPVLPGDTLAVSRGWTDLPPRRGIARATAHSMCEGLGFVLVRFGNGTSQYVHASQVTSTEKPSGGGRSDPKDQV